VFPSRKICPTKKKPLQAVFLKPPTPSPKMSAFGVVPSVLNTGNQIKQKNGTLFKKSSGVYNKQQRDHNSRDKKRSARKTNTPPTPTESTSAKKSSTQSDDKVSPDILQLSHIEIQYVGPLLSNPESLGYVKQNNNTKIKTPKYLVDTDSNLVFGPDTTNKWDIENQHKMIEMESSHQGDWQGIYEQFQEMNKVERQKMEDLGLVAKEGQSMDLTNAISFKGSCVDMCPVYDRVKREVQRDVDPLERDPATGKISRERALKKFVRPSGQAPPLPSDVRPPHILVKSLNYIVDNLLDKLPQSHSLIWDRTRSIRQDFTLQSYSGLEAIECNERICRIHLLCAHIMPGSDQSDFSKQQEIEQFTKSLKTLTDIYDVVRSKGGKCANEAEFRAYNLLVHFRDPNLIHEIQNLPTRILKDERVQLALMFRSLLLNNNFKEYQRNIPGCLGVFQQFFNMCFDPATPFLIGCVLELNFEEIRFYALKSISRSYHKKSAPLTTQKLASMLGFDSEDKLLTFTNYFKTPTCTNSRNETCIDISKLRYESFTDLAAPKQIYTSRLDNKLKGFTYKDVVDQGLNNTSLHIANLKETMAQNQHIAVEKLPNISFPQHALSSTPFEVESKSDIVRSSSGSAPPQTLIPPIQEKVITSQIQPPITPVVPTEEIQTLPKIEEPRFKDLPNFENACKEVSSILIKKTISPLIAPIVNNQLEEYNRRQTVLRDQERQNQRRQLLISSLQEELYSAFIREQVYIQVVDTQAKECFNKNLKRRIFQKFIGGLITLKNKQMNKRRKLDEIQVFKNKVVSSSQLRYSVSRSQTEDNSTSNSSDEEASAVQMNITLSPSVDPLWSPIDIKFILDSNLKLFEDNKDKYWNFMFAIADWTILPSKWLRYKFQLQNPSLINTVESSNYKAKLRALPSDKLLTREYMEHCRFLVFQVGKVDESSNLKESLFRDSQFINRLMKYAKKYSQYQIGVLVLYYHEDDSFDKQKIIDLLLLEQYTNKLVNSLEIVDMNKLTNDELIKALTTLVHNYKDKGINKSVPTSSTKGHTTSIMEQDMTVYSYSTSNSRDAKLNYILKQAYPRRGFHLKQ